MNIGYKIAGVLFLIMLIGGSFSYWYYTDSQETIKTLTESNAKLETAISINEQTISELEESYADSKVQLRDLNIRLQEIRIQNGELVKKFAEHNIGYLAQSKPGLVENIINNASDKVSRCFEILGGAPLTDKEKEAKSAKEFNSECSWLWPGNSSTARP